MRVQWLVPGLPTSAFQNGAHDLHFNGTSGWCWEEATWAGRFTGPGDQIVIGLSDVEIPDAVVVSPEGYAASLLKPLLSAPSSVAMFLRCVGAPSELDLTKVWSDLRPLVPQLNGIAVLSDVEKPAVEKWARQAGFRGKMRTIPLGAAVLPGEAERKGVVYLGRVFLREKGIDLLIEAAKRLPRIPFYFATPRGTELENTLGLKKLLALVPNAHLTTCGVYGRAALLQKTRVTAVLGKTDWQWLPGTECRGAHGVALAGKGTPVEAWNTSGLCYFNGLDGPNGLVALIQKFHEDDAAFASESERQHKEFITRGLSSEVVGKSLWEWVQP